MGGQEEGFILGAIVERNVAVVFIPTPRWPHMREQSCGFQTVLLRPLGIAEGSEVPQTFIIRLYFYKAFLFFYEVFLRIHRHLF